MKHCPMAVLLVAALGPGLGYGQAALSPSRTNQLEITAHRLVTVLEKGTPEELVNLLSIDGVQFGTDSPPTSLSEIRFEIAHKDGVFCELFDTSCLRDEALRYGETGTLYTSLRQRIRESSSWSIRTFVRSPNQGSVVLELRYLSGFRNSDVLIEGVYFDFEREEAEWKLKRLSVPGLF